MQYSPKLKKAIEEIKAILKKHDIAAFVALHTPGHGEFLLELSPSYSCAKFNGDTIRVKAKLKEDFAGDRAKQVQVVTDTSNMLRMLAEMTRDYANNLDQISRMVDKVADAEHDNGGMQSSTTQNN